MVSIRLWRAVLVVGAIMLVALTLNRTISLAGPHPTLHLEAADCLQPCWESIQPGISTLNDFNHQQSRSQLYRYQVIANTRDEDGVIVVRDIQLNMRGDVLLGDVLVELGMPTHADLSWIAAPPIAGQRGGRQTYVGGTLYFADGLITVEVLHPDCVWRFAPKMIVRRIRYYAPHPEGGVIPIGTPVWDGFVSQLPPTDAAC